MKYYGLFGNLVAKSGKGDELASILLDASKILSNSKGCRQYIVSKDLKDEDCIWINEIWDSIEDHHDSLKMDGVKELISKAIPILAKPPEKGFEMEVIGGKGI